MTFCWKELGVWMSVKGLRGLGQNGRLPTEGSRGVFRYLNTNTHLLLFKKIRLVKWSRKCFKLGTCVVCPSRKTHGLALVKFSMERNLERQRLF
jgi:hypothetical protein